MSEQKCAECGYTGSAVGHWEHMNLNNNKTVAYSKTHPPFRKGGQLCPCSPDCDPKNYEGRLMLFPDEAYHNWYFNMKEHPNTAGHREKCYDCMDNYLESSSGNSWEYGK